MADNIAITQGSGTSIAADDISSVWHQRVKISLGADGTATDALGGAGAVAAGVMRTTLASDDPAVVSLQIIDDWDDGDYAKVTTPADVYEVTLSLDTSAYAANDLLAETQEVSASFFRKNAGIAELVSLQVVDEDDQKIAMDIFFINANNTFGSENSAPSISDAHARDIVARVSVLAGDYIDLGGVAVAHPPVSPQMMKGAAGDDGLWVAAVTRGAPTHTASGVRLKIGVRHY